jgi:enoyl-CoA hydratase/carnithine racemase
MSVLVDIIPHSAIREIRLARAPVNALNTDLCRALITALNAALAEGVRGIVLSGNDKVFSAGLDVPHLLSHGDDHHALLDSWQAFFGVARTLAESRVPVVAALLVSGELVPAERALEIGLIDELVAPSDVVPRAVQWLQRLLALPHHPMLQTRAIARADLVAALHADNIQMERFIEGWYSPDAQQALQALVAKLGK